MATDKRFASIVSGLTGKTVTASDVAAKAKTVGKTSSGVTDISKTPISQGQFASELNQLGITTPNYSQTTGLNKTGQEILSKYNIADVTIAPEVTIPEAPISPYTTDFKTTPVGETVQQPTPTTTDTGKDLFQSYVEQKQKAQMPSMADEFAKAEKQAQIVQKQQIVSDLSTQINSIAAQQQADILAAQNQSSAEGGTVGILSARQDAINRSAAIKILPLEAQRAAAQDNLEYAQERLNTLFDLKVKDAEIKYEYQNKLIDTAYQYATTQQQNALEDRRIANQNAFTTQRDNVNYVRDLSTKAMTDGNATLAAKLGDYASGLTPNTTSGKMTTDLSSIMKNYGGTVTGQAEIDRVIDINGVPTAVDKYGNVIKITGATGATTNTTGSTAQLSLMNKTLENVFGSTYDAKTGKFIPAKDKEQLYKYSGQNLPMRYLSAVGGASPFQQLENYTNTLKTNMLTLATDPNIKKFFGPQMSNADVQLMMSGGSTLDPKSQTPKQYEEEALRIADFIKRAEDAVTNGIKMETSRPAPDTQTYTDPNGVSYKQGADGLYYPIK